MSEEFTLTFKQALKAVLDGKTVMCETTPMMMNFDGGFRNPVRGTYVTIEPKDMVSKWKVVE